MSTKVIPLRGVRKPSLILVKGGRGKVATPPLTDDERYPRFPAAWTDWLVLGLGLAALNLPFPVPLLSIAGIALIALLVSRHFAREGGRDPNTDDGITTFFASFVKDVGVKRPLERRLPKPSAFDKQVVVFLGCEVVLYVALRFVVGSMSGTASTFLTLLLFVIVAGAGLKVLLWWDTAK